MMDKLDKYIADSMERSIINQLAGRKPTTIWVVQGGWWRIIKFRIRHPFAKNVLWLR